VTIVILATLVIKTITHKGPIVFLKLGEATSGQYDAIFTPISVDFNQFNDFEEPNYFLNYTQIHNLYNTTYNLAPRKQFCSTIFTPGQAVNPEQYLDLVGGNQTGCLMLMET